ncbi:hypothetical protein L3Q82_001900 [Scortum barcoo]|uniref:Uncharacterized protein n=1 Tax=Scortum barcoo TaxID=214431 RepID=A0ACB8W5E1_9TELE|nr:hypothetical protein L3Q82_001900 [Scortum barcoo]
MDIDTVKSYKYLGVHLNDSLDWSDNTNALVKKGNSRLFLLRRLSLLGQQHHGQGQEENGQTGEEGQLCPGMPSGLSGGGGKREDDG